MNLRCARFVRDVSGMSFMFFGNTELPWRCGQIWDHSRRWRDVGEELESRLRRCSRVMVTRSNSCSLQHVVLYRTGLTTVSSKASTRAEICTTARNLPLCARDCGGDGVVDDWDKGT